MTGTEQITVAPLTAGAGITWTHFTVWGERVERTGTVWDRGPSVDGALVVCWVVPDQPLPGDLYAATPVGKATRRQPAHGTYATTGPWTEKYELFSSDSPASALGCPAVTAARCSRIQREGRPDEDRHRSSTRRRRPADQRGAGQPVGHLVRARLHARTSGGRAHRGSARSRNPSAWRSTERRYTADDPRYY